MRREGYNYFIRCILLSAIPVLVSSAVFALDEPVIPQFNPVIPQFNPVIPQFDDVTVQSGVAHQYGGSMDYVVGGGAATFDCNEDGYADLAIAGGAHPMAIYVNQSQSGDVIRFEKRSSNPVTEVTGLYPLDINADGHLDLFVLRFGTNKVLLGRGACSFEEASDPLALPDQVDWSTAFAATWEKGRTLPTLAIGNYVPRDRPLRRKGNCEPSYLLRSESGRYQQVSLGPGGCTLSALFVDWSGTGHTDLRLANDREYYDEELSDQLWRLTEKGVRKFQKSDGWAEPKLWGMGIAAQDITGNGRPEMVVTSMADNRLETLKALDGKPDFRDVARDMGANAHQPYTGGDVRPSTAWHTEFADFNNDAKLDLLIVKGNVDSMQLMANFDPDNLLLGTSSGFLEAGDKAGIAVDSRGRGAAIADFNLDGALDLVTINRDQPVRIFQQEPLEMNFVSIDLQQNSPNRDAIGATVFVKTGSGTVSQTRRVGGGHGGGSLVPLHFGIASDTSAKVRVAWPDSSSTDWQVIEAGQRITMTKAYE